MFLIRSVVLSCTDTYLGKEESKMSKLLFLTGINYGYCIWY